MEDLKHNQKFFKLLLIIFIETALFMLMGATDTLMLSAYSDDAVAAVGLANQSLTLANMLFMIVSTGTIILISQYIGAKRMTRASDIAITSIIFAFLLGIVLSTVFLVFDDHLLAILSVDEVIYNDTKSYLNTITYVFAINAINPVFGSIFRGFNKAKYSLYISLISNIINVTGNAIFIFGLFGIPQLGVQGVAYSTITAIIFRAVTSVIVIIVGLKLKPSLNFIKNFSKYMREVIKVGTPTALESAIYNIMQFVVVAIVSTIGKTEVITRIYILNLSMFIFLASVSFAQTNQIIVGNYVGAKREQEAFKMTNWSFKWSVMIAIAMTLFLNLFNDEAIGLFTNNPDVITLGKKLLLMTFLLEIGRALNLVYGSALKGAGDVYFPLKTAFIFMLFTAIPLSYLLGIHYQLGLIGVWIAYVFDELSRGIIAIYYWQSRKWMNKAIIQEPENQDEELMPKLAI